MNQFKLIKSISEMDSSNSDSATCFNSVSLVPGLIHCGGLSDGHQEEVP